MDIVRAGIGLSKTIKNVGRFREIVTVFAKNGFAEFLESGVAKVTPNFILPKSTTSIEDELSRETGDIQQVIGKRLRICFEELGPAFIKIGQLLSSREDLFSPAFIAEMRILQDQVKGIPFDQAKGIIESSLGKPIDQLFKELDPEPIGKASIGVVYSAVLSSGEQVVVKVRRPNIRRIIKSDMEIFLFLIEQIERVSDEFKYLGLSRIIQDFARSLETELNFYREAQNCQRLQEILNQYEGADLFYLPKVYDELLSENILVMEKIEGIAFSSDEIQEVAGELRVKLERGIHLFIKTFLKDGFFHADLHGGNFFYMHDGRIGLIDFGLMGMLSKKGRINFIAIIYAILTYNFESLVYEFLDVADYDEVPDTDKLIFDIRDALIPHLGLSVQQTNMSQLFSAITQTLNNYKIFLPREWVIVFRALVTLDGVGKNLQFDVNIFGILEEDMAPLLKSSLSKEDLLEEISWFGKDYVSLLRTIPRHTKWFLKEFSKNRYQFKIRNYGYEKQIDHVANSIHYLANMVIVFALILLGIAFMFLHEKIAFNSSYWPTWVSFGLAAGFFMFNYLLSKKH